MRILLVEDEIDLAEPIRDLLRLQYDEVVWVATASEASRQLKTRVFDLVMLDVMLPEGDEAGFRLASDLRRLNFSGKLIFFTACDAEDDRQKGLQLGADAYLLKGLGLREVLAQVQALLPDGSGGSET